MTDIVPFLAYFVAFNFEALGNLSGLKLPGIAELYRLLAAASFVHARHWQRHHTSPYAVEPSFPSDIDAQPCPIVGLARSAVRARLVFIDRPTVCTIGTAHLI